MTTDLETERKSLLSACERTVNSAVTMNRELTADERVTVEKSMSRIEELDRQLAGRRLVKSVMGLTNSDSLAKGGPAVNLFTPEDRSGIVRATKTRTSYQAEVDVKAALLSSAYLPPVGEYVQPGLHPNSEFPISSLFNNQDAPGPTIRYYQVTAGTAAVVAEGAAKPDAGITITPKDLPMEKLAATAQYSTEMSEDAPYLVDHLSTELIAAVAAAENARILAAFGAASGILTGSGTTATIVDILADAIASQEAVSGKTPTAVIANPSVVATIRKAKSSGSGDYTLEPLSAGPTTIHGVRVVSTPATPAATAWVVEATGVIIYRRGQLFVSVGTTNDDWTKNLRTCIAEERVGTAVVRPTSLTKLTLS
jgi:hypothetical protein